MRACDVQVGEVRAVRLVQVVVAFPEWGVRGRYHGQEERRWCDGRRDLREREQAVFEDSIPYSDLLRLVWVKIEEDGGDLRAMQMGGSSGLLAIVRRPLSDSSFLGQ